MQKNAILLSKRGCQKPYTGGGGVVRGSPEPPQSISRKKNLKNPQESAKKALLPVQIILLPVWKKRRGLRQRSGQSGLTLTKKG